MTKKKPEDMTNEELKRSIQDGLGILENNFNELMELKKLHPKLFDKAMKSIPEKEAAIINAYFASLGPENN